ncbi:MAG: MerR family DNA-binding transcriptional regulator [Candidatus Thermoplasmatota archaeon]|nr:MerR family DNA-binding transcriptional regulator [Candidatus Thermoplasmatota archaeon]
MSDKKYTSGEIASATRLMIRTVQHYDNIGLLPSSGRTEGGRHYYTQEGPAVEMLYKSHDGEEGFPGNLTVRGVYILTEDSLRIDYEATTDKTTVINLTNHAYRNLNGHRNGTILEHML